MAPLTRVRVRRGLAARPSRSWGATEPALGMRRQPLEAPSERRAALNLSSPTRATHRMKTVRGGRGGGKSTLAAVAFIVMMTITAASSTPQLQAARGAEEAELHAEAQRRQLVVVPAPELILFTALHPVGGQLADSVYNDGVRMQSMPQPLCFSCQAPLQSTKCLT